MNRFYNICCCIESTAVSYLYEIQPVFNNPFFRELFDLPFKLIYLVGLV